MITSQTDGSERLALSSGIGSWPPASNRAQDGPDTRSNSMANMFRRPRSTVLGLSIPELAFIAATRGMAGAGIALLAAEHLSREKRKAVGWTLLAIGALTTIPIAIEIFRRRALG